MLLYVDMMQRGGVEWCLKIGNTEQSMHSKHLATKSLGEPAYELDLIGRPLYHDGTRRKVWGELGGVERWSWERNPTPRWPAPAYGPSIISKQTSK